MSHRLQNLFMEKRLKSTPISHIQRILRISRPKRSVQKELGNSSLVDSCKSRETELKCPVENEVPSICEDVASPIYSGLNLYKQKIT